MTAINPREVDDFLATFTDLKIFEMARKILGDRVQADLTTLEGLPLQATEEGFYEETLSAYGRELNQHNIVVKAASSATHGLSLPVADLVTKSVSEETEESTVYIQSDSNGFKYWVRSNPEPHNEELLAGAKSCLPLLYALSRNARGDRTGTMVQDAAYHASVVLNARDGLPGRFNEIYHLIVQILGGKQFGVEETWIKIHTEAGYLSSVEDRRAYAHNLIPLANRS